MTKPSVSPPATELLAHYWNESTRPLVSLAFVTPMLITYEIGLLLLGGPAIRSGVDVWLRTFLNYAGLEQYFLLPILTCGILLAWHHLKGERWNVGWFVLYGMILECILLGAGLLVLGHCQHQILGNPADRWILSAATSTGPVTWVAYFGAGIYEELLFRLMLLPALSALLRSVGLPRRASLVTAVIAGSLLFAVAHYQFEFAIGSFQLVNSIGDPFEWITFSFRFLAGIIFSLLFVYRGFGVAAGAHALYDILLTSW